ncbi:hypothetical protein LTR62_003153 [Meristemomyces frigidus]|uniref:Arylamine N-acetyltransferase n=1 Tax=Meristemomyces frigidus TaxID=1508187 RepID=A0AAN7TJA9_9PEZI|nr:hypothetical protein LTR62_003153 [Meristemomyces frigidus]
MSHPTPASLLTQMQVNPKDRPLYTDDQIKTYLKRINLPEQYYTSPILSEKSLARTRTHGLPLLEALVRYHVCNIPFENLEIHYSKNKLITLEPYLLYAKFAGSNGRGGRCMENNTFFATVLRSLGYDVRNCGGRVSRMMSSNPEIREHQGETYDGWNHMLNLVRLDGKRWVVDVGMGVFGLNLPVPLEDGFECESIAPRRVRLQRRVIPEHASDMVDESEAQKMWCYDACFSPSDDPQVWTPVYCFTETEFLPQDYEMMSWFTSTHPSSFFTKLVLCMKMEMDEAGEKIVGDISLLRDRVRRSHGPMVGGRKDVLRVLETEEDRAQALRELFGLELTEEERQGIRPENALAGKAYANIEEETDMHRVSITQ